MRPFQWTYYRKLTLYEAVSTSSAITIPSDHVSGFFHPAKQFTARRLRAGKLPPLPDLLAPCGSLVEMSASTAVEARDRFGSPWVASLDRTCRVSTQSFNLFNRQLETIEFHVSHSKQRTETKFNRQLFRAPDCCPPVDSSHPRYANPPSLVNPMLDQFHSSHRENCHD
jgi:hypothetical protein